MYVNRTGGKKSGLRENGVRINDKNQQLVLWEHRLHGRLTKDRPLGISFARNSLWTIVCGRFDKLPNNCQMLENDKVETTRRKSRSEVKTTRGVDCLC